MVYSANYVSVLTPGMFDDRVRIRYDSNHFSNAFYYENNVKKVEILTSRINSLPVDSINIDIYTNQRRLMKSMTNSFPCGNGGTRSGR